jgi:glycosyltransferase involved in cell wall biosynthesis
MQKSKAKVTFLVTVYNKEKYLKKVFEGIKNQVGDFEREYIIVNDGSTDNSLELIKELTKDWKNYKIINQKNAGVVKATIKGIEESTGDYIKFVDGDDYLHSKTTSALLSVLKTESACAYATTRMHDWKKYKYQAPYKSVDKIDNLNYEILTKCEAKKYHFTEKVLKSDHFLGATHTMVRTNFAKSIVSSMEYFSNKGINMLQDHILTLEAVRGFGGFAIINAVGMKELSEIKDSTSLTFNASKLVTEIAKFHLEFFNYYSTSIDTHYKRFTYIRDIERVYNQLKKKSGFKNKLKKKVFNLFYKSKINTFKSRKLEKILKNLL